MPASSAATTSRTVSSSMTPPALATPTIMVLAPSTRAWAKSRSGNPRVVAQRLPRNCPTHQSGRQNARPRAVFAARSSRALPRYSR